MQPYSRKSLVNDLVISLLYTAVIVLLIRWQVLKPITDYFHQEGP